MSREMSIEDKRKFLLAVADGKIDPYNLDRDHVYIWLHYEGQDLYEGTINDKHVQLNEAQYKAFMKRHGKRHVILIRFPPDQVQYLDRADYEAMAARGIDMTHYAIDPNEKPEIAIENPIESEPKASENRETHDIEAEIIEHVPEDTERINVIRVTIDESHAVRTVHDQITRSFNNR